MTRPSSSKALAFPDGKIRINQTISTVNTLIHECLHRLRPQWSERAVRARTTRLMRQMSYQQIDKLYEIVLSTARHTKEAL
jgi:hypothetical protein